MHDNVNTVGDVCVFDTDMNECENVHHTTHDESTRHFVLCVMMRICNIM